MTQMQSFQMVAEMKEFATFDAAEQRYIRRSLEVARVGADADERWSRNGAETASIRLQAQLYRTLLQVVGAAVPDDIAVEGTLDAIGPLITV
jgi:hypothetical protein